MDAITTTTAEYIVLEHWNVRGQASELPSYSDRNFRIRTENGDFVLKIAHPSWAREEIDLENQAMLHLAQQEPQLGCPQVRLTASGEHLLSLHLEGQQRLVRLLSFVPGTTYADTIATLNQYQREALHDHLGQAVGKLTRGLSRFQHPAAARMHEWNLLHLPALLEEIPNIEDSPIRTIVAQHAQAFCNALAQRMEELPIQPLHNDANDLNVLIDQQLNVAAIIDFGDLCTSFRLADLAITCTYAMQFEEDPITCARRIAAGYLKQLPLLRCELEALQDFILARLCQSILMATRNQRQQPDNAFVMVSQQGVRKLLTLLSRAPRHAIVAPLLGPTA